MHVLFENRHAPVMKKIFIVFLFGIVSLNAQTIHSPHNTLSLTFSVSQDSVPMYSLSFGTQPVILPSVLGIALNNQPSFLKGFSVASVETSTVNTSWTPVWGEVKTIKDNYRELKVTLRQPAINNRTLVVTFRLFDEGLGFRYEFPKQNNLSYFIVSDELTQFALTGDHMAFWIPGDFDTNEYPYNHTRLSDVNADSVRKNEYRFAPSPVDNNSTQTPLMMKTDNGLYINISEAALVNYPAMCVEINKTNFVLTSAIAPDPVGNKAYLQTPCTTPWRTILVSDKAADLLASKMILNLNEPCTLKDVSWIKPMKYVGVWWEMHVGQSTWNYSDTTNLKLETTDWAHLKPNGHHGATTERTKVYIDFAAKHHIDGVLVEGWNIGWEDWYGNWKENVFDFVTPYPDFDVDALQHYAAAKGVKLIMHHETAASVTNYERRMDDAYRFMKAHGYDAVKTGYVGRIIPRGEYHDGQWMVNHYIRVAEKTAQYHIMVDMHEPVRPSGLQRTYPNWLASEAARGNEYNAWSVGNDPDHETILPFTRFLGGPMDYTPGIFQTKMSYYDPKKTECVHTTLVKQLALYVTIYSPLQMAADLPENYNKHLDAFQFIEDVPVDWDDTKIIAAEPGDYITIARKAKNKNEWYLGAITDEHARSSSVPLNFLGHGQPYVATIYADAADADWDKNPMAYTINSYLVSDTTVLKLHLAPGGGAAVSLKPASMEDNIHLKTYQ